MEPDAPHEHQRLAVGCLQTDGYAVGDGEHLTLHAVGPQDAVDGVLHAEGLRAGHGQVIAHGGSQIGQKIVVHLYTSPVYDGSRSHKSDRQYRRARGNCQCANGRCCSSIAVLGMV